MGPKSEGSLEDHDAKARQVTREQHGEELTLVDDLLAACLRGFSRLGFFTLKEDNRVQYAQLLLATRSFNSLRCSYELLLMGYYTQSLTLVRSAMEDDLTALDCEKHQATVEAILEGKGELGKGKLTYTEMAKRQSENFQKAWQQNYGALSEYAAHARYKSVRSLVKPQTKTLLLGGHHDREFFIGVCDALLPALIGTADLIAKVLASEATLWQKETYPKLKAANVWRERIKRIVEKGEPV